jgi:hypothetical protein
MSVELFQDQGTGDIDHAYGLPADYYPVFLRVHFERITGSGTDTAELVFRADDQADGAQNHIVWRRAARGVDADVNLRFAPDWRETHVRSGGTKLRVAWTNPDAGDIRWGLQMGLKLSE